MNNPNLRKEVLEAIKTAARWGVALAILTAVTMFGASFIKGPIFYFLYFYLTVPATWPLVWTGQFSINPLGGGFLWCLYCVIVNGFIGAALGIIWRVFVLILKTFISDVKKNFQKTGIKR